MPLYGTGPVTFVDEFDAEFSRDIEPMKGGHGDNYYYQMIAGIRRFKGVRPIPPVVLPTDRNRWPVRRLGRGRARIPRHDWRPGASRPSRLGKDPLLFNRTGRNDIVSAKVGADEQAVTSTCEPEII